jgi:hypothetical protein
MLNVRIKRVGGKIISAEVIELGPWYEGRPTDYENRNNWQTFEHAQEVAAALGEGYVATDSGPNVSPRYDVIDLPKVGADVSYAFNGDYYPCGKVKSISAGPGFRRIVAGPDFSGKDREFWRRCHDGLPTGGAWISERTWSLVPGHISKTNPEF